MTIDPENLKDAFLAGFEKGMYWPDRPDKAERFAQEYLAAQCWLQARESLDPLEGVLKACPFCNGTDIVLRHGSHMPGWDEDVKAHQCQTCEAIGPTLYRPRGEDDEDRLTWNTRAAQPDKDA